MTKVKRISRRIKNLAKREVQSYWRNLPIMEKSVLFESYSGNGMLCHPEAIFRYMLERPEYSDFKFTWVLNDIHRYESITKDFESYSNVSFVKYGSLEYHRKLSTSKYLVNNVSFPAPFVKRDGQVYLNTWHGVPLKKMGYDIAGRPEDAKNIVRNFLAADYLLSSSPAMTDVMYSKAFKLQGIYEGQILEEGNPRTDRQQTNAQPELEFRSLMENYGVRVDDREIILYAPTWKGESYFSPHNDAASLKGLIDIIEEGIDSTKYQVLLKAHQVVSAAVSEDADLKDYLIPNGIPTNVALGATSILVTDYSSIFYDFLSTGRPVVFYIPDIDDYRRYRDLYVDPEDLPGRVTNSATGLVEAITLELASGKNDSPIADAYKQSREKYVPYDDGRSTERVVNAVFRGGEARSIRLSSNDKLKILLYAGGLIPNGITTSALNLLDNIDYSRFDVTVLCPYNAQNAKQHIYAQINPNARVLFRFGTFTSGYLDNALRLRVLKYGNDSLIAKLPTQKKLWETEWRRCFGNAKFDHMIDFSGYTAFWGMLFLHGPESKKSIWLHNDLAADALRSVEGDTPLKDGLYSTFSIYRKFDNLVSVSQGLNDINRLSLAKWAPRSNFSWASNTVNEEKIRQMAALDDGSGSTSYELDRHHRSMMMGDLVQRLIDPARPALKEIAASVDSGRAFFTFFSAGRLSPEKNHIRLVRAFARVHKRFPATRLVIAGDGPLKKLIRQEIVSLGLTESVKLVGHIKNPYQLMSLSDAFVLSSDYEGQPMVLLEALVLGVPVITTSFGSVKGALPKNVGRIVAPTVDDLAAGMITQIESDGEVVDFDVVSYNKRAITEFEQILLP
ncbi:glycosyltransferase [Glutamicibacter mishrai]|uniref:Glycosyltransferase n=1 Tax=Glutamicibacter mishrai TaxID=1775880 RepID=A0A6H0SMF9_9MICC|nr:glycosyltransferase [Glutamicibacter mishrai]QIV88316.1 glycosyltransferase [Glutamicibacter mishrai]